MQKGGKEMDFNGLPPRRSGKFYGILPLPKLKESHAKHNNLKYQAKLDGNKKEYERECLIEKYISNMLDYYERLIPESKKKG